MAEVLTGRALDAAVAERVLGWTLERITTADGEELLRQQVGPGTLATLPRFSDAIEDAMPLLTRCDRWTLQRESAASDVLRVEAHRGWSARIVYAENPEHLAETICRAMLLLWEATDG